MLWTVLSRNHVRDEVRPTVWGYAVLRATERATGLPGVPPVRGVSRTDVVVPGLTPSELERVQDHVEWHATLGAGRLSTAVGVAAGLATLLVGAHLPAGALVVATLGVTVATGATTAILVRLLGPHLTRVERRALREAVEIREVRSVPTSSVALRILTAMHVVDGAAPRLAEPDQALARELLWSALAGARRGDEPAVRHATAAMLTIVARATSPSTSDNATGDQSA